MRDFKKKNALAYGFVAADSDADVLNYGVYGIPAYVLIDRRGNLRSMGMGASGPGIAALEKMIKKLIDEPVTETDAATEGTSDTDKKSP